MIKRAVLLLATFALIAGCGSEEGGGDGDAKDDDPLVALAQAARKSAGTESFRYTATMESDFDSEPMKMDATGTATADSSAATMKGTIDVGQGPMEFEGIVSDGTLYMSGEDLGLPAGKWAKTEDAQTRTMSPSEFVKYLQDSGDVALVGTETIRGEEAQHFRGPLNMKELIEKEAGSEFLEQMKNTPGVEQLEVVVDIWVPDSGLPSKMALDMSMPGQDGSMKITSDVLEYDVPVDADPPPDDKVLKNPPR